jgi:hypothetical protein
MRRIQGIRFVLVCFICLFVAIGTPLSSAEAQKLKMKPCEVTLADMENIFLGTESVTVAPYFTITNPNNFPVRIPEFKYAILLKDYICDGKSMPYNYYIPAKGKITLSSAFAMLWPNMAIWEQSKTGKDMANAIQAILPLWKNLNGQLFNPQMKEVWDKIPEEPPIYLAKGQIDMIGPKGEKLSLDYSTTWKQSAEYKLYK